MAKRKNRKKPSTKGHPQPIQAWQLATGVIAAVLVFALWMVLRSYQ